MRISHRYKFVFFANPKTGSASVREMLDPYSDIRGGKLRDVTPENPFHAHMRPPDAREEFRKRDWPFEDYYRFTFVRNPWKRLASLYQMMRDVAPDFDAPFLEWLRNTRTDGSGGGGPAAPQWIRYGAYSIANYAGDAVSEVFRLEDIDKLPDALRKRGIPIPPDVRIPRRNMSPPNIPYGEIYTPEAIEIVRQRYAEDIERFGYSFTD